MRKPISVSAYEKQTFFGGSAQKKVYYVVLCDDGTIWELEKYFQMASGKLVDRWSKVTEELIPIGDSLNSVEARKRV